MKYYHYDKITSTSEYARNMISSLELPCVISANEQSQGRGRKGNLFYSPADSGAYFTYVSEFPDNVKLITCGAAVAICNILTKYGIKDCKIKWVNDIYLDSKKVSGILTETYQSNNRRIMSIGIGINITTKDFPEDIKNAGSLNVEIDKNKFIQKIVEEIIQVFKLGDEYIFREYSSKMFLIGKKISYKQNNLILEATVKGLNRECNLIVLNPEGKELCLSSGEIQNIEF